jgi:hypothetical protein
MQQGTLQDGQIQISHRLNKIHPTRRGTMQTQHHSASSVRRLSLNQFALLLSAIGLVVIVSVLVLLVASPWQGLGSASQLSASQDSTTQSYTQEAPYPSGFEQPHVTPSSEITVLHTYDREEPYPSGFEQLYHALLDKNAQEEPYPPGFEQWPHVR